MGNDADFVSQPALNFWLEHRRARPDHDPALHVAPGYEGSIVGGDQFE